MTTTKKRGPGRTPGTTDGPTPPLTAEELRHFVLPKTWAEIVQITTRPEGSWRAAIVDADEFGACLLRWLPHRKAWVLTTYGQRVAGVYVVETGEA